VPVAGFEYSEPANGALRLLCELMKLRLRHDLGGELAKMPVVRKTKIV
jgi:hypothetical protein